jgi:glycosyltransferase involved in cell wall biosynthesis
MISRRILLVVTKMDLGGAMVLPLQLAAELRARGHVVETWYLYRYRPAYETEPGVRIVYPGKVREPIAYLRVFLSLLWAMRRFRPDTVHGVLPLGNVLGLLAAWMIGCPVRVASQHTQVAAFNRVMRFLDKLAGTLGIYTHNVAVSRSVAAGFEGHPASYRKRLLVIQNGVADIRSDLSQTEARDALALPRDAWLMGTAGRLSPEKNHHFLVRILASASGIHLAIAGDGSERLACEALAVELGVSDRLHLVGAIPGRQIPDFLQALDVFVLPSRYEGLPISLIEAMKLELPIVASDIPPAREVLESDDKVTAGIVIETETPAAWAEAITMLRDDPERRKHYACAAQRRAGDFTLTAMADRYEKVFAGGETTDRA